MSQADLFTMLGISSVHEVSEHTTVIEFKRGGARPATDIERRLFVLLLRPGMAG